MTASLTSARLRELLSYDPLTGKFIWLVNGRGRFMRKGKIAGTVTKRGYRQICIDIKLHQASRLAVLWMTNKLPKYYVDHKNMIKNDDRWCNLRQATNSQNGANSLGQRRRSAKFKGVVFDPKTRKYSARIKVQYRNIYLGSFSTQEAAHGAYARAAKKHFGEFARF